MMKIVSTHPGGCSFLLNDISFQAGVVIPWALGRSVPVERRGDDVRVKRIERERERERESTAPYLPVDTLSDSNLWPPHLLALPVSSV